MSRRGRRLLAFNKPYRVLCQFTTDTPRPCLADYIDMPGVYPAGRLDHDSEGLLLLTDDGRLQARIASPANKLPKRYWVQVEGVPDETAIRALAAGPVLKDGPCRPPGVRLLTGFAEPWSRDPPIRERREIPTTWLELTLTEGRNRQIRRMTAAVGHPTLRLIRHAVGDLGLDGLAPGQWREVTAAALGRRAG